MIYSFNTLLRLFIVNKYFYRRQNHRKDHVVVYTINKKNLVEASGTNEIEIYYLIYQGTQIPE